MFFIGPYSCKFYCTFKGKCERKVRHGKGGFKQYANKDRSAAAQKVCQSLPIYIGLQVEIKWVVMSPTDATKEIIMFSPT